MRDGRDPTGETEYHWYWYEDENELELHQYYRIVHTLTGWNIPLLEYLEVVSPEDLATMPPGMYELLFDMGHITPLFEEGYGSSSSNSTWYSVSRFHIWVSPDGETYNGDLPPYQWLVWRGWEEYADHLPAPPEGAPFPAPEYKGTPRNTLPFARMDLRGFYDIDYEIENPCPDAIIDPIDLSDWDWTLEMKEYLANLGLDPDMGYTRLGYEKSGMTITMVGMTPSGVMKEWTLTLSKGGWTCDSASAEDLENILFILKKIDAISDNSVAAPAPAVTEKRSLSSLKDLVSNTLNARIQPEFTTNPASLLAAKGLKLNEMDMDAVKGVNSSALLKSNIVSGKSTIAAIPDRSGLLSRTGALSERKSIASAKAAGKFQKSSQARARG